MKLRPNWYFTKWDGLNILFFIQYIRCFKNFWGSANILLQIPVKMGKKWRKFESSIFFEAQKYYFVFESRLFFFFFFQMVLFAKLFRRCPTLWKSTLKMTKLFQRCLTLFNSTLKNTALFQRCSTLQISTLTYTTMFQGWFDVVWPRNVISIQKQRETDVEMFAGI